MHRLHAPAVCAARLLLAWVFLTEGWDKIVYYQATVGYMASYGVWGGLLPLAILTELGGGLAIATGWGTRWAAVALSGFCLLTALLFHNRFSDANELIEFQKDFAIAGGFLALAAFGPGAWSLDGLLSRRTHGMAAAGPSAIGR